MSPKNIYTILKPFIETVPLSQLEGLNIAVDGTAMIYFSLKNARILYHETTFSLEMAQWSLYNLLEHENKVRMFSYNYCKECFNLFSSLLPKHLIIFDGINILEEKDKEIVRRSEKLEKSKEILSKYVSEFTNDYYNESKAKNFYFKLGEIYDHYRSGFSDIVHNVPNSIIAPGEGDKFCSYLCKVGIYQAVFSPDYDLIMYGCPLLIRDVCDKNGSIVIYNKILKSLCLTESQFIDMCILMGTDYNIKIKGIGPKKALCTILEYGSLEEFERSTKVNLKSLNWRRLKEFIQCYSEEKGFLERLKITEFQQY